MRDGGELGEGEEGELVVDVEVQALGWEMGGRGDGAWVSVGGAEARATSERMRRRTGTGCINDTTCEEQQLII